jgi:hypothetical protein
MVRPSENSTVNVSSVTVTSSASGTVASISEVIIPRLLKKPAVPLDYPLDSSYFHAPQPSAPLYPHRIEPELRYSIATCNMYVLRLAVIVGIEKEAKWPFYENCWHDWFMSLVLKPDPVSSGPRSPDSSRQDSPKYCSGR